MDLTTYFLETKFIRSLANKTYFNLKWKQQIFVKTTIMASNSVSRMNNHQMSNRWPTPVVLSALFWQYPNWKFLSEQSQTPNISLYIPFPFTPLNNLHNIWTAMKEKISSVNFRSFVLCFTAQKVTVFVFLLPHPNSTLYIFRCKQ